MSAWILGIDEAGRGPVLGPMVYGMCMCKVEDKKAVSKMGFADSKQLNEKIRLKLWEDIQTSKIIRWKTHVISAEEISNKMLLKATESLNEMSHISAMTLISKAQKELKQQGDFLEHCFLDTVGPPHSYEAKLNGMFQGEGIKFTVESKADDTYPIVSAASICAKTMRDQSLENYTFREGQSFKGNLGCGYPGDEFTKKWLRQHVHKVFGFPTIARFSWSTVGNLLDDNKCVAVKWSDDINKNGLASFGFGGGKNKKRYQYYKKNCMNITDQSLF